MTKKQLVENIFKNNIYIYNKYNMNTLYKQYIEIYGNFSHILNIEIDKCLSEEEKKQILLDIRDLINEKDIIKNISNTNIGVKWRTIDFYHYFTDGNRILADKAIYEHTKLLLNDIKKIKNSDKFNIILNKPLTKSICIM
jgi:hypothetical protein